MERDREFDKTSSHQALTAQLDQISFLNISGVESIEIPRYLNCIAEKVETGKLRIDGPVGSFFVSSDVE